MQIIFEPQITGHRREYLRHLMEYAEQGELWGEVGFWVNEGLLRPKTQDQRVFLVSSQVAARLLRGPVVWRSWKYYRLARKCYHNTGHRTPDTGHRIPDTGYRNDHFTFLWLNDIQLFLGLLGFPVPVSGILFKPFIRMEVKSKKDKQIWKRKYWQTKLLVQQKKVERIWILEDEEGVVKLNQLFGTDKFAMLPEPVSEWVTEDGYDVREDLKVNPKAKLFIHVGTLSTRKGSDQIIRAVDHLAKKCQEYITILMAGKPQPGHEVIIREALESVKTYEHIQLIYKPQYLTEERFQATMEQADGMLIPYLNPESSSGVLARSILNGKPVLGVNKSLMGQIINQYQAGVLIDEVTPMGIANGIVQLCKYDGMRDQEAKIQFKMAHDPIKFSQMILGVSPSNMESMSRGSGRVGGR